MRLFTWLLVGAVLFRGLIPAGYMPQAGGEKHLFNIVICTAAGSQTITVDDHGQPAKNNNNGNQVLRLKLKYIYLIFTYQ